ncbi:hypothetical protein OG204_22065 [Streptomyces sp. NBC_01387]|uniref:hypothetical protein n=1 Tax=unclassified Streptomyces TaxID=2593676 RepID=UPI002DD7F5A6|nr:MULTISPECIES: hypothetical protein [unclassified Streptomyces]WSC20572.1 hypothetical protein OIE60_13215 [Streptomyces sp. NBC_01766]
MARRTPTIAAALAVGAALLLTACGGSSDNSSSDKIKGAGEGSKSPSASASTSTGDGRPDVSVPADLHLNFDFDKPSDAKHAAALADAENYIRALDHGINAQDPNDPAYKFYSGADAAHYAKTEIQAWVTGGWTATGTDRYYNAEISPVGDGKRVSVTFCRDQSKFYGKEIKTKKILQTKASSKSFQKFSMLMDQPTGSSDVWKTQLINVKGTASECQ